MRPLQTSRSRTALAVLLFFCATARIAGAGTIRLAWDPSPDTVSGYVVYVGTQPGTYSVAYDVGNNLGFALSTAVAGQPYYFVVASYTPGPTLGPRSAEVVGYSDTPPTLVNPGSQFSTQGQSVSLQLVGSDPDGKTVSFSASGLPPGLQIVSTGRISGAGTTAGTYNVAATVSDGALTASSPFTWTVTAAALVPPTLISPSGSISTATPAFTWTAVANAGSYQLLVTDASSTAPRIQTAYTPAQAGCASSQTCTVTPGVALAPGAATWWIVASNTSGNSATSTRMAFAVPSATAVAPVTSDTTAPVIVIRSPAISSGSYSTTASPLIIAGTASDNVGVTRVTWAVERGGGARSTGVATGTTNWSVTVPLTNGQNKVIITAQDAAGNVATATVTVQYKASGGGSGKP